MTVAGAHPSEPAARLAHAVRVAPGTRERPGPAAAPARGRTEVTDNKCQTQRQAKSHVVANENEYVRTYPTPKCMLEQWLDRNQRREAASWVGPGSGSEDEHGKVEK